MAEVVSVRFKSRGKSYYFDPQDLNIATGVAVIVETSKGLEYGKCTRGNFAVDDSQIIPPLRPVVRVATEEDQASAAAMREKESKAFRICADKIRAHGLEMKLVDVEYNFEGSKILFFFTSDGRVDFRELVKDLANVFRTRIELRQIGVRDEAKMLGGLGICGKPFCCAQFLDEFQPVSIKMAKTQALSLNPTKISGTCGRLMCCLKYEQNAYEDLVKNAPKVDSYVETPEGNGTITEVNLLRQQVKVRMDGRAGDPVIEVFPLTAIQFIKTGKQRRADLAASATEDGAPAAPRQPGREARKPEAPAPSMPTEKEQQKAADGAEHKRRPRPGGGKQPGGKWHHGKKKPD